MILNPFIPFQGYKTATIQKIEKFFAKPTSEVAVDLGSEAKIVTAANELAEMSNSLLYGLIKQSKTPLKQLKLIGNV